MLDIVMERVDETSEPMNGDAGTGGAAGACCGGVRWVFPVLLVAVLAAIIVVNGRGVREPTTVDGAKQAAPDAVIESVTPPSPDQAAPAIQTVSMTVDFGAGRRREWKAIPWREGLTVESAMNQIATMSQSEFAYTRQGTEAAGLLLTEMGGVANEGADGKNWTYHVNGERADRSFGVYDLRPGDQVLWTFGEPR
jgi:hypothetical protein